MANRCPCATIGGAASAPSAALLLRSIQGPLPNVLECSSFGSVPLRKPAPFVLRHNFSSGDAWLARDTRVGKPMIASRIIAQYSTEASKDFARLEVSSERGRYGSICSCQKRTWRQMRAINPDGVGETNFGSDSGSSQNPGDEVYPEGDGIPVVPLSDLALGMSPDDEPWMGAVLFRRSNVQTQYEFRTTLERLGLAKFSTKISEELAYATGIKLPEEETTGTPVNISCHVERNGSDLRLAGIVRSAISLGCKRCLKPAAERLFANFDLVLTATPAEEPTQKSLGVVLDGPKRYAPEGSDGEGEAVLDLDMDDRLYFPAESRQMDLSKYIRDVIHLEAPMFIVCRASCRGLCLFCGGDLNDKTCACKWQSEAANTKWGVLEQIKSQIEDTEGNTSGG